MSTKTSIKRIAAVAAVALTLGGFSAVSAHADSAADTLVVASNAVTATAGTAATVAVTQSWIATAATTDTAEVVAVVTSAPAGSVALPTFDTSTVSGYTNTNVTFSGLNTSTVVMTPTAWTAAVYNTGTARLSFTPTVAGTYTVKLLPYIKVGSSYVAGNAAPQTITYTVAAKAPITAATSTIYMTAGTSSALPATPSSSNDVVALGTSILAPKAGFSGNFPVARIDVAAMNSLTADNASAATISATVAGPGLISFTNDGNGRGRAISQGTAANSQTIYVFADGTAGTGTVTISSGTTVLGTENVTFYGPAAKFTATVTNAIVTTAAAAAAVTTTGSIAPATPAYKAVKVLVADANGNPVAGTTVYANSDNTSVINASYLASTSSDSTGYAYFNLVGVAAGTANISFTNHSSATDTTTEITASAVSIRVGSATASSVAISFDSNSYQPGQAATVTVSVLDSKGLPVANGVYSVFTAATTSTLAVLQGTMPGTAATGVVTSGVFTSPDLAAGSVWVNNGLGTATYKVNMPLASGTVTFSGTGASGLAAAQAGLAVSASTTIGGGAAADAAQAAVDAANEATDAANAATDAANNAMDSADAAQQAALDAGDKADAALAAVTDLATKVSAIATQIAALSALVKKIAAKVKA
jgi:protocatechuate 3,4-dioxygenase beta subunit